MMDEKEEEKMMKGSDPIHFRPNEKRACVNKRLLDLQRKDKNQNPIRIKVPIKYILFNSMKLH